MKTNRISRPREQRKVEKLLVELATIRSSAAKRGLHERDTALPVRVRNFNAGLVAQST